jgi:hypothetical protein
MTTAPCRPAKQDAPLKIKGAAVKASLTMTSDSAEFAMLLFQVRSVISASGCADRIDDERWSTAWLDTPNVALRRVRPQCLIKQMYDMPGSK